MAWWVKNPPANAGNVDLISGLGRSPGGGCGNPLQYSCLENPMDKQTTVHRVRELDTTEVTEHTCKKMNPNTKIIIKRTLGCIIIKLLITNYREKNLKSSYITHRKNTVNRCLIRINTDKRTVEECFWSTGIKRKKKIASVGSILSKHNLQEGRKK